MKLRPVMDSDELIKYGRKEIVEIGIGRKIIRVETYRIGPCGLG